MDTIHVLKQWSSIKPELQLLHSVIVERDIQDIGSLVDEIYRSDLKKVHSAITIDVDQSDAFCANVCNFHWSSCSVGS